MTDRNVLLTGLPRSGTTLTCNLLNRLPDAVALFEPMNVGDFGRYSRPGEIADHVMAFFADVRVQILTSGTAPSKLRDGEIPTGHVPDERGDDGLRHGVFEAGVMRIDKPLPEDFQLTIKHPSAFTALLPDLAGRLSQFAVCRNPVSLLASWNSVDMRVRRGRIPAAERLEPELASRLDAIDDRIDRQFVLLDWFFGRYERLLPRPHVIRYEDIVATGGRVLSVINPVAQSLRTLFESRNRSPAYDHALMERLGNRLMSIDGPWLAFYTTEEIGEAATGRPPVPGEPAPRGS